MIPGNSSRRGSPPNRVTWALLAATCGFAISCGGGVKHGATTTPPPSPTSIPADPLDAVRPPVLDYHRPITAVIGGALGDMPQRVQSLSLKQLVAYAQNARDQIFDAPATTAQVLADSQLLLAEASDALVLESIIDRDDGTLDEATHAQVRQDLFDRYAELAFPDSLLATVQRQLDAAAQSGIPADAMKQRYAQLDMLKALAAYARAGLYALGRDALTDKPQARVLERLGQDYRDQGDLQRAIAAFRMSDDLSQTPDTEMLLAEALYASGDTRGGDEFMAHPLPADASTRAQLLRNRAQARKTLMSLTGTDPATITQRIQLEAELGDLTAALNDANDLIKRAPKDPASYGALALASWYDGGDPQEAYLACKEGAAVTPHAQTWLSVKIISEIELIRQQTAGTPITDKIEPDPPLVVELDADAKELAGLGKKNADLIWPLLGRVEALRARGEPHVAGPEGAALLAAVQKVPRDDPSSYGLDMVQYYLEMNGAAYAQAPTDLAAALARLKKVASSADAARLDGLMVEANLQVAVRDGDAGAVAKATDAARAVNADGDKTWAAFYAAQISTAAWLNTPRGDRGKASDAALQDLALATQTIAQDTSIGGADQIAMLYPMLINLTVLATIEGKDIGDKSMQLLLSMPVGQYPEAQLAEAFVAIHKGDLDDAKNLLAQAAQTTPAVSVRAYRWLAWLAKKGGDAGAAKDNLANADKVAQAMGPAAQYGWLDAFPKTQADATFLTNLTMGYDLAASQDLPASQLAVSSSLVLVPDPDMSTATASPSSAPASAPSARKP
jgi:tetratricopeptide (TPR) repeat protein